MPWGVVVITPKASVDGLVQEVQKTQVAPQRKRTTPKAHSRSRHLTTSSYLSAVAKLNDHLTTLHAALPARTTFILFSGHSDPRKISALPARRAEYQASQNHWPRCRNEWQCECGAMEFRGRARSRRRSPARGSGRYSLTSRRRFCTSHGPVSTVSIFSSRRMRPSWTMNHAGIRGDKACFRVQ